MIDVFEDLDDDEISQPIDDEPPRKRIRTSRRSQPKSRWIPGGRGGGGRHVDADNPEMLNTPLPNDDFSASRTREGREATQTMATTPRYSARSRNRGGPRPRYSTAAAASAAVAHGDGYKPREERGWEEFHPDLELDSNFAVIESEDVDGIMKKQITVNGGDGQQSDNELEESGTPSARTPLRRPGRPPRNRDSMLNSLIIPEPPKVVPIPGPNPRERLTLPKPSYRELKGYRSDQFCQSNYGKCWLPRKRGLDTS
jgi:NuA3 HAT complex component NTO1